VRNLKQKPMARMLLDHEARLIDKSNPLALIHSFEHGPSIFDGKFSRGC
jgi:hypothetical protein